MSRVALFDLDGTLTRTNEVDGSCFLAAVEAELGVLAEADWSRYRHCTDEGIGTELWLRHVGAPPAAADLARLRRRFLVLLRRAARAEPHRFDAVDGALELLRQLPAAGWTSVIATGAWEASARLKLRAARLPIDLPLFACDSCPSREAILARALAYCGDAARGTVERAVSIGDGVWDVAAAAALGLPFVGVATGVRADRLREAGARVVIADFRDLGATLDALQSAPVPHA